MKKLLYYPGFEVKDENWLKFALLYMDDLKPIIPMIPYGREEYLSETTRKIMEETDLINPYIPNYDEGICASIIATEEFEKYLRMPNNYRGYFGNNRNSHMCLSEIWKRSEVQKYTLFRGKFSDVLYDYCLREGIAHECDEGIRISQDLAFVYMSLLADVISKNNEFETITEYSKYNNFLVGKQRNPKIEGNIELITAKTNIELSIPVAIRNIPIERFIELRGANEFSKLRIAYSGEIRKLITARENGNLDFSLKKILSYKRDFVKCCEYAFDMLGAATMTAFGVKTILENDMVAFNLVNTVATAYMDSRAFNDVCYQMPQFLNGLKGKHLARRYVAKIEKLNSSPWKV